jgi:hypothetical protein
MESDSDDVGPYWRSVIVRHSLGLRENSASA